MMEVHVALFSYAGYDEGELTFEEDQLFTVIKKGDRGWGEVKCEGKVGLVPANYIQNVDGKIQNLETIFSKLIHVKCSDNNAQRGTRDSGLFLLNFLKHWCFAQKG